MPAALAAARGTVLPPTPLRVSGALTQDARLSPTLGQPPHLVLWLDFAPAHGLPYKARVDLGTDVADHMDAEALLPALRTGAVVTVAANALELRTDHHHAALALVDPRDVLVLLELQLPRPTSATPANTPET